MYDSQRLGSHLQIYVLRVDTNRSWLDRSSKNWGVYETKE